VADLVILVIRIYIIALVLFIYLHIFFSKKVLCRSNPKSIRICAGAWLVDGLCHMLAKLDSFKTKLIIYTTWSFFEVKQKCTRKSLYLVVEMI